MNTVGWWMVLDEGGFNLFRLLVSLLWQSSILLSAVAVLGLLLRRHRASIRHAVWAGAMLLVPLLPLVGWVARRVGTPQAEIPVMPVYTTHIPWREGLAEGFTLTPAMPPVRESVEAAPEEADELGILAYPWAIVFLGYAGGLVVILSLMNAGRIRLGHCARKARGVSDPRVVKVFQGARKRFSIRREVALVASGRVEVPMTIGTFRPVVILPAGLAKDLSDPELEAMAIHEMAHVKRKDPLLLMVLSFVRGVLFFHPLVWVGCREVSALGESACDDAVLDASCEPVSYAEMLTRVAQKLPARAFFTEVAAGIVLSRSVFLRRITSIMSHGPERRRKMSRRLLVAIVVIGVLSLCLAAGLPLADAEISTSPTVKAEAMGVRSSAGEREAEEISRWKAVVPSGIGVELLGLSYHPSKGHRWWTPDGRSLTDAPYERTGKKMEGKEGYEFYEAAVRLSNIPEIGVVVRWQSFEPTRGAWYGDNALQAHVGRKQVENTWGCILKKPEAATSADLRIGVVPDEWETLHAFGFNGSGLAAIGLKSGGLVVSSAASEAGKGAAISVSQNLTDRPSQVVAVGKSGEIHEPERINKAGVKGLDVSVYSFPGLEFSDVAEFRLQQRTADYEWVEFKGVSLRPERELEKPKEEGLREN